MNTLFDVEKITSALKEQFKRVDENIKNAYDIEKRYIKEAKGDKLLTDFTEIVKTLDEPYTLMVVGEQGSGKSSLINTILGKEILPVARKRVDSTLVYLNYDEKPHGKVSFIDGKEIDMDIEDALSWSDWRTRLREELERVEEITIYLDKAELKNISIVNSAGLNDIYRRTEEKVRKYLKKAHAIIWVFYGPQAGGAYEKEILEELSKYNQKVIGVINWWDAVKNKKEVKNFIKTHFGQYIRKDNGEIALFHYSAVNIMKALASSDKGAIEDKELGYNFLISYLRINFLNPLHSELQKDKVNTGIMKIKGICDRVLENIDATEQAINRKMREEDEELSVLYEVLDESFDVVMSPLRIKISNTIAKPETETLVRKYKQFMCDAIDEKMKGIKILKPKKLTQEIQQQVEEQMEKEAGLLLKRLQSQLETLLINVTQDLEDKLEDKLREVEIPVESPGTEEPPHISAPDVSEVLKKSIRAAIKSILLLTTKKGTKKGASKTLIKLVTRILAKIVGKQAAKQIVKALLKILGPITWSFIIKDLIDIYKTPGKIRDKLKEKIIPRIEDERRNIEYRIFASCWNAVEEWKKQITDRMKVETKKISKVIESLRQDVECLDRIEKQLEIERETLYELKG